ncbi:MAG: hydrogenase nickel incorporation protein HypB [Armatimonadota bacterium]
MSGTTKRTITIGEPALKRNDALADQLRSLFADQRMLVVNMLSSPGSGKTELLKKTAMNIGDKARLAVIVGDLATENDAVRIRAAGITAIQIVTGDVCHLDSSMVTNAVAQLDTSKVDILFIENVGNLVCPSSFDLGEDKRVVLLSCTEGEDKPLKYPSMFATADLVIVNKMDVADVMEFNIMVARRCIQTSTPHAAVLELSAKAETGISAWIDWLIGELKTKRSNSCK